MKKALAVLALLAFLGGIVACVPSETRDKAAQAVADSVKR